jgi:hypothetical protein
VASLFPAHAAPSLVHACPSFCKVPDRLPYCRSPSTPCTNGISCRNQANRDVRAASDTDAEQFQRYRWASQFPDQRCRRQYRHDATTGRHPANIWRRALQQRTCLPTNPHRRLPPFAQSGWAVLWKPNTRSWSRWQPRSLPAGLELCPIRHLRRPLEKKAPSQLRLPPVSES